MNHYTLTDEECWRQKDDAVKKSIWERLQRKCDKGGDLLQVFDAYNDVPVRILYPTDSKVAERVEKAALAERLLEVGKEMLTLAGECMEKGDITEKLKEETDALAQCIEGEHDDPSVGITGWNSLHALVGQTRALLAAVEQRDETITKQE